MTTVVYRDGVMAGDQRVTAGSTRDSSTRKVYRRKDGCVLGGCGAASIVQRFVSWFLAGEKGPAPSLGDKDDDAQILVVRSPDVVEFYDRFGWHPISGKFFAIGSGSDVAFGALEMGASARKAVAIAARRDVNTGDGVAWVKLG